MMSESVAKRILQNADILDARMKFANKNARHEKRISAHNIVKSANLVFKAAKLFGTGGGNLIREKILPKAPELATM